MNGTLRHLLKISELAQEIDIPPSWLYERSRRDALPGLRRLGRHLRVDRDEFFQALREGKIG